MPRKPAKKKPEAHKKQRKLKQKTSESRVEGPRIGVFVCHCGSSIASVIDVDAVTKYARTLPNVVYAEDMDYPCSRQGQQSIKKAIRANKLDRIIVAGCSPRLYEPTFQSCVSQAELNPWLFEMANIREFASYCHKTKPEEATEKAKDTVRMAVAKARLLEPLKPIELPLQIF